ncbi:RNA polymerase sigma factor SigF [Candidatus Cyanaurora vandensis]|uniref:RNA polymerase sigma factor SigF n=1 Tax=Candidatus Cyanaurora vandensis TaxID=2714958 RepID=UPI00257ED1BE|nr:RNA polymerase sigma factor SigF [Candidatus Cyanaurora vandensis]
MVYAQGEKVESLELLQAYREKPSVRLRNELVRRNVGLVRKVAHQVSRRCGEPYEDLVQVGCLGLIRAVERFDVSRGHSFSSFAVPYIRGEMQHYLRDRSSAVRIPRRLQELARRGRRAGQEATQALGRTPGEKELADLLEISFEEWRQVKLARSNRLPLSLDAPVNLQEDATFCLGDLLPDYSYQSFCLAEEDRLRLQQALTHLEDSTRQIIEFVFFQDLTQTETARRLGLSPMTVSRRITKGLRELWGVLNSPV